MKLLVLTNSMAEKCGTNRVVSDLVGAWAQDFTVKVVALEDVQSAYAFPAGVQFEPLRTTMASGRIGRTWRTFSGLPRLVALVRAERPDAVLSFLPRANIANVMAKGMSRVDYLCVLNERNFNGIQYGKGWLKRSFKWLMRATYPRADLVVANAEAMAADLSVSFGVPKTRTRTIWNPFDLEQIDRLAAHVPDGFPGSDLVPVILNVARLIPQKNHAFLFRVFAKVRKRVPARLALLGEGPLKSELVESAVRLGIKDDVQFLGWKDNPYQYMRRATVFVLSSDYEGFPNVLVEAMASGCPVVSTDCPSGPREILDGGRFGALVPLGDEDQMAEAIVRLIQDPAHRTRLGAAARERAKEFDLVHAVERYRALLFAGRTNPSMKSPSRSAVR